MTTTPRASTDIVDFDPTYIRQLRHGLKSPLATIEMAVDNIDFSSNEDLLDIVLRQLERLRSNQLQVVDLVEMLLGTPVLHKSTFDLSILMRDVHRSHQGLASLAVYPCPGIWDERLMARLFGYLLDFAKRYSSAVSVSIRTATNIGFITVSGYRITADNLNAALTSPDKIDGVGLEMVLALWIVQAHGGTFDVIGDGESSTIRITLASDLA